MSFAGRGAFISLEKGSVYKGNFFALLALALGLSLSGAAFGLLFGVLVMLSVGRSQHSKTPDGLGLKRSDLLVAVGFGDVEVERLVAALVPIYFGRVGSLVIENRRLSEEQAEEHVERQAREFELRKPYLVERWRAAEAAAAKAGGAGSTRSEEPAR